MASKRKLDEDAESFATPSKAVKLSEEVKRSGRVRKKPARFKDTEEESDEEGETVKTPKSADSVSPIPAKSGVSPKGAAPVSFILKQDVLESPTKTPKAKVVGVKPPGVVMVQNPGLVLTGMENTPVVASPHVVPAVAPVSVPVVVQAPVMPQVQSPGVAKAPAQQSADSDNKSGRVRKKSTKVLEMEAFEEAERTKVTAKKVPEAKGNQKSPAARKSGQIAGKSVDTGLTGVTLTGLSQGVAAEVGKLTAVKMEPAEQMLDTSIPPQALSQPAIPGKMDPALANLPPFPPSKLGTLSKPAIPGKIDPVLANLPPFPPSKLGNSSKKGKKKKDEMSALPTPPLVSPASPILSAAKKTKTTPKPKKIKQPEMMETEPHLAMIEDQDAGSLQPGTFTDSSVKVKTEPISPGKTVKKGTKVSTPSIDPSLIETGIRIPPAMAGQSGSVIKMLLNTPTQFSSPTVSTQSINSGEKVQKVVTDSMDTSVVKSEAMYLGDESTLLLSTDIMEQTETVGEEDVYDKKKPKKIIKKTILMDPMDDDDDDDDLDDLDDDDDDFDNVDESGEWEFENQDGKLVIADFPKKGGEEMDDDKQTMEGKGKKSPKRPTPKKRASNKGKGDGADGDGEPGDGKKGSKTAKEKKKKRLTAYTMWCNTVRNKVLSENQGMDFAQLSRRLGEIWQGLPAKAKMAWKRKAKREARKLLGKGLLISTSKGGGGVITTTIPSSQAMAAAAAAANAANTAAHAPPPQQVAPSTQPVKAVPVLREEPASTKQAFGIEPIDVSAHLKLVGESLSIIGMRLQEHRGLIAVQGSLSVLLDSMLCALGPLMCLTTQIPEMNGCSSETHSRTLDNVAFFMPGL